MPGVRLERLRGVAALGTLARADSVESFESLLRRVRDLPGVAIDTIRPLECQFLLQHRARLFGELGFSRLRRCQVDIETGSSAGGFSDASVPGDRVLAIGLRFAGRNRLLMLEEMTDEGEKRLLASFNRELASIDPDVIEGHNIFKFDLDYLRVRCRMRRVPCAWGRFGQRASFRNSRLKVAERWIDFPRCDLPGRAVADTYLLALLNDISARELNSYGLKEVAVHYGITDEEAGERTYIEGGRIAEAFAADRDRFAAYLADDLRETEGLGDLLLPTYFEQARAFPIPLQEATLRGTTVKIDLLLLEEYYHAGQSCPQPPEIPKLQRGRLPACPPLRRGLALPEPAAHDGAQPRERHSRGLHPAPAQAPRVPPALQGGRPHRRGGGREGRGPGPAGRLQDPHQLVLRVPGILGRPLRGRGARGRGDEEGA
jgi:hypothetical protein